MEACPARIALNRLGHGSYVMLHGAQTRHQGCKGTKPKQNQEMARFTKAFKTMMALTSP